MHSPIGSGTGQTNGDGPLAEDESALRAPWVADATESSYRAARDRAFRQAGQLVGPMLERERKIGAARGKHRSASSFDYAQAAVCGGGGRGAGRQSDPTDVS
jgi:hypothetical protein